MKYEDIIIRSDGLSCLSVRWDSDIKSDYKSYYITGTHYVINVHRVTDGSGRIVFVSYNDIHNAVGLQEIFDDLPEEIKEEIVFHLDLFR